MELDEQSSEKSSGKPSKSILKKTKKRKFPFKDEDNLKEEKEKRQKKRARIIVRNISFKATPEKLREHFEVYGKIEDLNLLKRPDNKLVGCAFIQYESVNQATKAILKANSQLFLGRPVYVDWALSKDEYISRKEDEKEKKPKLDIKDENVDAINNTENSVVKSEDSDEEDAVAEAAVKTSGQDNNSESEVDVSDGDQEIEEEESNQNSEKCGDEDSVEDKKEISKLSIDEIKKEKVISNDVVEGCTVFIKNIPFEADDNDLRKTCRKYGPIYYAIINREAVSGHSKGTGFIKFKTKESADLCLCAGTELTLFDEVLDPHPALSQEEIKTQSEEKAKSNENKDSRNLYLAREGLIMAGSKAAEGVSDSDMKKRHKLEQVKAQVLKNLNRFVSRNRLSIHNLPLQYDDEKLKQMIISYTGYKPHECRVMRERKITPDHPKGKSKGFGFMSFKTHKEAISALRKLNNNPKIFTDIHRPIVAFSIEDRAVHKIKAKREEKSKLNNPTYQEKINKIKEKKTTSTTNNKQKGLHTTDNKTKLKKHIKKLEESRASQASQMGKNTKEKKGQTFDNYVGTTAEPGTCVRMRSTKKIHEQAQEHKKRVSQNKRKEKNRKIKKMHRQEKNETDHVKPVKKIIDRDNLSHLVDKYKKILDHRTDELSSGKKKLKRTKWYKD